MGIDREEAKKLKPLTEKEYQELKQKCEENDGYASITGDDLEKLTILSYKGDERARKILDSFNEEVLDKEIIEQIQESWILQDKVETLLGEIKENYDEAKEDPKLLDNYIQRLEEIDKLLTRQSSIGFKETPQKKTKRTKEKSYQAGAIANIPEWVATLNKDGFQNYLGLQKKDDAKAYLEMYNANVDLEIKGTKLSIKSIGNLEGNKNLQKYSEIELQNYQTKEGISKIDMPLLRYLYSILWKDFVDNGCKKTKDIIIVNAQDLAEKIGIKGNISKNNIKPLQEKMQSFHHIVGVMSVTRNGKKDKSYYQVLNFEFYDSENNNIAFSSPYMNKVIGSIQESLVRPQMLQTKQTTNLYDVYHSNLIDSSIISEKNKAAVENVFFIIKEIEQTEDNIIIIPARVIVENNDQLNERMKTAPNATKLLNRTFTKTWELLQTKTKLIENYKNLCIKTDAMDDFTPFSKIDFENYVPTKRSLYSMIFHFSHNGKAK